MTISVRTSGLLLGGLLVLTACGGGSESVAETAAPTVSSTKDTAKTEPPKEQAPDDALSAETTTPTETTAPAAPAAPTGTSTEDTAQKPPSTQQAPVQALGPRTAGTATAPRTSVKDTTPQEPLTQQAPEPAPSKAPEPAPDRAVSAGTYVDFADFDADRAAYSDSDVVLFFHASWCSTCKKADANLTADPAGIPAGLAIIKIDFDSSTDLRRQYGVTQQHTFVSISPDGSKKNVFTGATTAADIAARA